MLGPLSGYQSGVVPDVARARNDCEVVASLLSGSCEFARLGGATAVALVRVPPEGDIS